VYKWIVINENSKLKLEVKTELTERSSLRRRRFALDCSASKEEEGKDYIKNYEIWSENKFTKPMF
jgi:hypothetical protein